MLSAAVMVTTVMVACQSQGLGGPGSADARFGLGFTPDARVTLQDDVVVVQGGSDAIRSASADGLTWFLNPDAEGADDLVVGQVMIATSRAVGRVVDVRRSGPDLAVTLVPVGLGELIKDADLRLDAPLDLTALRVQEMTPPPGAEDPQPPGGFAGRVSPSVTAHGVTRLIGPALRMGSPQADPGDDTLRPPKGTTKFKSSIGNWEVEVNFDKSGIGFKVQYKVGSIDRKDGTSDSSAGLKFGFDVKMKSAGTPRVSGQMRVRDGVPAAPTLKVDGFNGMDVNVYAGAPRGKRDDVKVRFEVPVEVYADMPPIYGVPTAVSVKFKLSVDVFLGGNNATLSGLASYNVAQTPFSLVTGTPGSVDFAVKTAMINTLDGLSLAPSGVTFGLETRWLWGLGFSYAHVGPFVKLAASWGVGLGSALFPYFECKLSRLRVDVGGGIGVAFNNKAYLDKVLGPAKGGPDPGVIDGLASKFKTDIEFGVTKTVVDKKAWAPADKPVCAY